MDPITLAVLTSGVTTLAVEVLKGSASEAGKDLWKSVKLAFGWKEDPAQETVARDAATALAQNDELARRVTELLKKDDAGTAGRLVGSLHVQGNSIVAGTMNVEGGFHMGGSRS